jgi:tetratricopeptide (TPR) repeat protein
VEKELNDLKENILNQKVRSQKIENAIKEWNGMGYKISKLESMIKKDMDEAEKIYEDYKIKIKELMDFENKLQNIKHKDLDDIIHKVHLKIKNPEMIDTLRKEMAYILEIVSDFEGLRTRRKDLNDLLKVWRGQGYKIDNILQQMREEDTVKGLEKIILQNTRAIASLESFKNALPSEERGWFPDEEDFIRTHMDDPEMSDEVLGAYSKLKKSNRKEEKRRGEISRKLKELSNRGIDVSRVEPLLIGDKKSLDEEYTQFKEYVKKLLKMKAALLKQAKKEKDQGKEMFAKSLSDPYSIDTYEAQIKGSSVQPGIPNKDEKKEAPSGEIKELRKLAKEAYKDERLEEALRLFDIILSMDPKHKESKFYKKKVLLKLKSHPTEKIEKEEAGEEKIVKTPREDEVDKEVVPGISGGDPNCLSCKGSGKCIWCGGSAKCSTCNGTGKSLGDTCQSCKGAGECNVCKGTGKCSWCNI